MFFFLLGESSVEVTLGKSVSSSWSCWHIFLVWQKTAVPWKKKFVLNDPNYVWMSRNWFSIIEFCFECPKYVLNVLKFVLNVWNLFRMSKFVFNVQNMIWMSWNLFWLSEISFECLEIYSDWIVQKFVLKFKKIF